jgi:hypothetical protein
LQKEVELFRHFRRRFITFRKVQLLQRTYFTQYEIGAGENCNYHMHSLNLKFSILVYQSLLNRKEKEKKMNIGVVVEVAIGVMFVWILLALITSQMSDWVSSWFKWRANMLAESIQNMLSCESLCEDFYKHPLINGLHSASGKRKPSAIPGKQFASVVFDIFINAGTASSITKKAEPIFTQLRETIHKIGGPDYKEETPQEGQKTYNKTKLAHALDTLLIDISDEVNKADASLAESRKRIETWYDDAMTRLSGHYKRRLQLAALVIGMAVSFALNADSLAIASSLWTQPLVREAVVAQAEQFQLPENQGDGDPLQGALATAGEVQALSIPIGWSAENVPADANGWFLKIGGIIVSGAAAAQGAPFWFEILRKILNFRSGGGSKKEEKE